MTPGLLRLEDGLKVSMMREMVDRHRTARAQRVVILFADISDSSRLYRAFGDARASAIVSEVLESLSKTVRDHQGTVVDRIGDELMCAFERPADAVHAAVAMQATARIFAPSLQITHDIEIRVGLHGGTSIEVDGKPVGDTVYTAKRLVDEAKAGQILLSESTLEGDDPVSGIDFRFVEETTLKGQSEPTRIVEIVWNRGAVTELAGHIDADTVSRDVGLEVLTPHGDRIRLVEGESITIGRVTPAYMVVNHTTVSRLHARLEGRKGRFYLIDVSTNGTFLQIAGQGEPVFLRRDELALGGIGMIGLGEAPKAGAPNTIQYRCLSS